MRIRIAPMTAQSASPVMNEPWIMPTPCPTQTMPTISRMIAMTTCTRVDVTTSSRSRRPPLAHLVAVVLLVREALLGEGRVLDLGGIAHRFDRHRGSVRADLTPLADRAGIKTHLHDRVRTARQRFLDHARHRLVAALGEQ